MTKLYTTSLTLLLFIGSFMSQNQAIAQGISFEAASSDAMGYITEFELVAKNKLVNTSVYNEFIWIREENSTPTEWTAAICDNALCHNIDVDSAEFTMSQNDSFDFKVNFYPQTNNGRGSNRVRVYAKMDPSLTTTAVFLVHGWGLSVAQTDANGFLVYPNPASDVLYVELPNTGMADLKVVNLLGQVQVLMHSSGTSPIRIPIETLPSGVYVLQVKQGSQTFTHRFTKN